jgi:polysaccharide biosynthesis/export protein
MCNHYTIRALLKICLPFLCLTPLFFCSCHPTRRTTYFQDIPDTGRLKTIPRAEYNEPRIQVDDILTVVIQTLDPQASAMINMGNIGSSPMGAASAMSAAASPASAMSGSSSSSAAGPVASPGYLVDKEGTITLPVVGKLKVAGQTTSQAREMIQSAADSFYKDPSVSVRYANFKINVAGEVARPGAYVMPNERVSILDAITMAGDLTIFGKRENVLLIRENADGTKTPYRINLKSSDFISSPYFYLKQNDYIYVEPDKGKAAALDASSTRNYAIIASILTIIIVIVSRTN